MTMKRSNILLAACAIASIGCGASAYAQNTSAVVVAACGTPPSTYAAGTTKQLTQDTTGTLCTPSGGGGGGGTTPTGTAGSPNAAVVTVQGITNGTPQNVNNSQINGTAFSTGAGASGTGTQRVILSSDSPLAVGAATSALQTQISGQLPATLGAKAGTLSLSIVPNTDTPFPTYINPSAGVGQAIPYTTVFAAATSVLKASAGNLYGINANNSTTAAFVVAYNGTAAPTSGTALTAANVGYCFALPASQSSDKVFNPPLRLATGVTQLVSTSCTTYTTPAALPLTLTGYFQ